MTSNESITEDEYNRFKEAIAELTSSMLAQIPDEEDRRRVLEVINFRDSLNTESDRGTVLMAAAFLDDKLADLVKRRLVDDARVVKKALEPTGTLGTFSSRIDFCYLMGVIPLNACSDLHLIRKIRNDFAHVAGPISFDNATVKENCDKLTFHTVKTSAPTGSKFRRSVMGLLSFIVFELKSLDRLKAANDYKVPDGTDVYELVAKMFEEHTGKDYPIRDHHE